MKKFLLSSSLVLCVLLPYAQIPANQFTSRCSSYPYYLQQLRDDPQFARNQEKIEAFTQQFIKNGGTLSSASKGAAVAYTIPVVVHVVYKTNAQNISDAQVQSQLTVLNQDYQELNADVTKVPSYWTSLVADCQIQFCLATLDPSGNTTTGIVRKKTTKTSFTDNNNVKHSSNGGDNAWDATKYLNIWVCNLSGSLLGYAQFPGGSVANDGVVIDYTAFGTTGSAAYPYNKGRTATHEIGHWLNLRHIWGDDNGACNGSGDLVADTPNQADENYGCPGKPISCNNGPNGDMFINYMDYTDDKCMYMFTNGQKARMQAILQQGVSGSRYSITISGKCGAHPVAKNAVNENTSKLTVIPNPVTSGVPTFSYKLQASSSNVQVSLYNMFGAEIKTIRLGNQSSGEYHFQPADIARLENGVYVVKLIANGELIGNTRFIVSR